MPDMEACIKAGMPGDAHTRLDQFAGTWKATIKHWMEPGAEPSVTTGVMTNTWILGKRFLRQDHKTDGGSFEGTGYWGYNNVSGRYEGLWIDSMTTAMMTDAGDCDEAGKVWTMVGEAEDPGSGRKLTKRSVITLHDANRHTMEMYFGGPQGGEFKVMEIEFTR